MTPIAFTPEFSTDERKILQWSAFTRKGKLQSVDLAETMNDIAAFLVPVLTRQVSTHLWTPSKRWHEST
ncbi:hypothetical protein [Roseibacillus persicicus]|uniref:hypothetical protein n=1 Tax=Roseibacillus persicicus TaxID=454148 RepID=UPI00281040D5|nr:hypothetical protein [Roseibacillus persicicus]MDQ8189830.1 hypothetical protein [Roseibacillus persicicus]